MTDLADSTESLKRMIARPGTFATFFPETTDNDLADTMSDGIANAQLDGMLITFTNEDGEVTPDLSAAQVALVVMYAGAILIRGELFNRKTSRHYEASGAVFDEVQATNILRDLLKNLEQKIADVKGAAGDAGMADAFYMADAYVYRTHDLWRYEPAGW